MQEPISHVSFKVPCSFEESRRYRSLQICLQLNISWISSGDVSGDGLTSHRTSTSSLMHSRRNGGESENRWAANQEHEASLSRVPGGKWRPYSLLRLLTLTKTRRQVQVTWHIKNIVDDGKCVVYHFKAIIWNYKSDSKQTVLTFSNQIAPTFYDPYMNSDE